MHHRAGRDRLPFALVLASCIELFLPPAARAEETGAIGGGGGAPFEADCGPNAYLIGVSGRASDMIKQVRAVCGYAWPGASGPALRFETANHGGGDGTPFELKCPGGGIRGFNGYTAVRGANRYAGSISLTCGGMNGSGSVGWNARDVEGGGVRECPAGTFPTGIRGRSGSLVDQFRFICGKPVALDGKIEVTLDGSVVTGDMTIPARPDANRVVRWSIQGRTLPADAILYSYEVVKTAFYNGFGFSGGSQSVEARGDATMWTLPSTLGLRTLKVTARLKRGGDHVADLVVQRDFRMRAGWPSAIQIPTHVVLASSPTVTVMLDAPAQGDTSSPFKVELKSGNPAAISLPAAVSVPNGTDRVTFTATVPMGAPAGPVEIQAGFTPPQGSGVPGYTPPPPVFRATARATVTVEAVALGASKTGAVAAPRAPAPSAPASSVTPATSPTPTTPLVPTTRTR